MTVAYSATTPYCRPFGGKGISATTLLPARAAAGGPPLRWSIFGSRWSELRPEIPLLATNYFFNRQFSTKTPTTDNRRPMGESVGWGGRRAPHSDKPSTMDERAGFEGGRKTAAGN